MIWKSAILRSPIAEAIRVDSKLTVYHIDSDGQCFKLPPGYPLELVSLDEASLYEDWEPFFGDKD